MLERIVENWLTKVNERSLEVPFCQLLTAEGHEVVHLSRHGPQEQGKDILTIDPEGTPCAFQLKGAGGRISQTAWAAEYLDQVIRLVELPIQHPSIDPNVPRRVFFVTNGNLDEEVRREITDRNQDWEQRGHPRLETVVRGQLLTRFLNLTTTFWPGDLSQQRELLEFFLADGTDCLDKARLSRFVSELLPLTDDTLNRAECSRALASAAVITAYALSAYQEQSNHVAIFEGWTVYVASLIALVEKFDLDERYWKDSLEISLSALDMALSDLCCELMERDHLIEGDPMADQPFYRGRLTWLVGLVAAYALWCPLRQEEMDEELQGWIKDFITEHQHELLLWGEAVIPQFLAVFWYLSNFTADLRRIDLLTTLIANISQINDDRNDPGKDRGLPDPYHLLPEVVAERISIQQDIGQPEVYLGQSYTLEALVHLLAKRGWRQRLSRLWSQITRVAYIEFTPETTWAYCLWHVEDGILTQRFPNAPQSWTELRDTARECDVQNIPALFLRYPEVLLMFVLVFPHRLTINVAKFLDETLRLSTSRA